MSPKRKNRIVIDARQSGTSTGRYVDKLIENIDKTKSGYEIIVLTTQKRINYLRAVAPGCKVITTPYKNFSFGEQIGIDIIGFDGNLINVKLQSFSSLATTVATLFPFASTTS